MGILNFKRLKMSIFITINVHVDWIKFGKHKKSKEKLTIFSLGNDNHCKYAEYLSFQSFFLWIGVHTHTHTHTHDFICVCVYIYHLILRILHSLVVQWLRLLTPNARVPGLIPGQETRSHMPQLRLSIVKQMFLKKNVALQLCILLLYLTLWRSFHIFQKYVL